MIRTQIQLEEADFERLKREARRQSCSVSAFVRASVKQKLAESEATSAQGSVMELAGKYRSGRKDLAENHDEYLSDGW
jgi:predicted DNA-binding ribbon-helix-helix protein